MTCRRYSRPTCAVAVFERQTASKRNFRMTTWRKLRPGIQNVFHSEEIDSPNGFMHESDEIDQPRKSRYVFWRCESGGAIRQA